MPDPKRTSPAYPQALTVFQKELARTAALLALAAAGPTLWPRFAGYYQGLARLPRKLRRALQRQWRRSLGGIALLCALGQAPVLAGTIIADGTICRLINAVNSANSDTGSGNCPAGSGADTIILPFASGRDWEPDASGHQDERRRGPRFRRRHQQLRHADP